MPINSCTFVEPAIAKAGVHAHDQEVLAAVVQKVGDVEAEGRITVVIASHEVSVHKHQRAAKGAIELDHGTAVCIFLRNVERAPVPAHAGLRIPPAQRFVAVRLQLVIVHKGQLDSPVVRQVERSPLRIVELCRGKLEVPGLGEISLAFAESQVAQRIAAVSLKELPAKIKQQMLPRSDRRQSLCRRRAGIAREQCVRAAHTGPATSVEAESARPERSRSRRVREDIRSLTG